MHARVSLFTLFLYDNNGAIITCISIYVSIYWYFVCCVLFCRWFVTLFCDSSHSAFLFFSIFTSLKLPWTFYHYSCYLILLLAEYTKCRLLYIYIYSFMFTFFQPSFVSSSCMPQKDDDDDTHIQTAYQWIQVVLNNESFSPCILDRSHIKWKIFHQHIILALSNLQHNVLDSPKFHKI